MATQRIQQQVYQDLLRTTVNPDAETAKSLDWLSTQKSQSVAQMTPNRVMTLANDRMVNQIVVGRMYLFAYDAKTKDDLPYWDKFPLIFPFRKVQGGFYGINMHYLPPLMRAKLMDQLYDLANNLNFDDTTKLRMSYQILNSASKFRFFKPCVKHYLNKQVKSRFLWVPADSWDRVLFLPLERFVGASKQKVFTDSRNKIRG